MESTVRVPEITGVWVVGLRHEVRLSDSGVPIASQLLPKQSPMLCWEWLHPVMRRVLPSVIFLFRPIVPVQP